MRYRVKIILQSEKGFTLLEMLVVLSIFVIVHSAILYISHEPIEKYTEKQLMNQNELLIRMTQLRSIETVSPHSFQIANCRKVVIEERTTRQVIYEQQLPAHIDIFIGVPASRLIFNTRGNVQAIGSMMYHFDRESHEFSVNIGKARILEKGVYYDGARDNTCGNIAGGRHSFFSYIDDHSLHT